MADDAQLVEGALNGDRDAFGLLVRKYQAPTYALTFQRVGRRAVAEEITQDVFVAAYHKLDQLEDGARFGSWLRTIALRHCAMWHRSETGKPRPGRLPADLGPPQLAPLEGEEPLGVDGFIQELPEGMRAAALLCFEDELSPSAAAAVLGIKPGALRKRLHDARARLQRQIVEWAEKELRTHLLPKGFAERCVCRCEKAEGKRERR
ncbi:MAG: RNA polymerase sigma factor [Planctomycetota bacterium]|jgi:RNA polymerase sigma-70 factor (ECF subfamily)